MAKSSWGETVPLSAHEAVKQMDKTGFINTNALFDILNEGLRSFNSTVE
ncbi:hypothetical protein [Larkinella harenae]